MRREVLVIAAVVAVALVVRTYPAWTSAFASSSVNFLETDAWYHVRLVENQVRNFPWRVTLDPYAAPGGQFVPIAPLYDTITAAVVVLLHGRDAATATVERVAALVPPTLGALAVLSAWRLGRRLFGPRAGLIAAALLAVLPGQFMDRTMLAFVDHHALEALLALATLLAIVRGIQSPSRISGCEIGISLGLYLLAWASGAFLVAIVVVWVVLLALVPGDIRARLGRQIAVASLVAVAIVMAFQDARMHRFGSQVVSLIALLGAALMAELTASTSVGRWRRQLAILGLVLTAAAGAAVLWRFPDLPAQLLTDVGRLTPDPSRMGVLEARPLFLYSGEWKWSQPWLFFRTGFYAGLVSLVLLGVRLWRSREPGELLLFVFAVASFAATIGQNRFGYYLVPACALVAAWLADRVLEWGSGPTTAETAGRFGNFRRAVAWVAVAGLFAPNLAPAVLLQTRNGSFAPYWQDTMAWLRDSTPTPFPPAPDGTDFYLARYPSAAAPVPDYAVMNWWDHGYWIMQAARRVPVSNPTQQRALTAARFYAETDQTRARALLAAERARFVVCDWEMPFRMLEDGTVMGRFQSVLQWAGATETDYYEVYYRKTTEGLVPVWVFHEPYYRSMTFRLVVLGGTAATPAGTTTVVTVANRTDRRGSPYREILTERAYPTYRQALAAAALLPSAQTRIVGLNPWRSAFPVEATDGFRNVFAAHMPGQPTTESPWVRVFDVR